MSDLDRALRDLVAAEVRRQLEARPTATPAGDDQLLTVAEAAERLAVSVSYVRAAVRAGRLPAVRLGRAVRVRAADVDRLPTRRRVQAETAAERARRILAGGGQ